jgi:UDP-3-O-[3-hydroxymyristoyl] glucosamine N-acyltransferase
MTVREIAEWFGGEIIGPDPGAAQAIERVAKIEEASAGSLTFIANPKYERHIETTDASAVLVSRKLDLTKHAVRPSLYLIRVDDPYMAFLLVLKRLTPQTEPFPTGIHPTAVVPASAKLGKNVALGAYVVVGEEAVVGDNTKIGACAVVGKQARIGEDCLLYPGVVVYHQCRIGARVIVHAGAVIGSDGFGFAPKPDGSYEKIPQLGIVVLEDDVEIGANTTIDRATIGETLIRRGVKIDNLVQIAHNVVIGENTGIAAQTGISGSTKIGKNCMLAGQVGIAGHLEIADRTIVYAQSGIHQNIEEPGKVYFGYPADDARKAQRAYAAVKMLPEMIREFTALKNTIAELQRKLSGNLK